MTAKPRRLALVKYVAPKFSRETKPARHPFKKGEVYVFLGEIPNMPGHCVVAERVSGKIYAGYHTESFIELAREKV